MFMTRRRMIDVANLALIKAKRDVYQAMKELEDWSRDKDMWREIAVSDFVRASKAAFVVNDKIYGTEYAMGWQEAMYSYVKAMYRISNDDFVKAELKSHED